MEFSCSAAVPGGGSNKEYAMHQLYFNKGDILQSTLALMSKNFSRQFTDFIGNYHYQDSDIWTTEDIEVYTEAMMKEDKDFVTITNKVVNRLHRCSNPTSFPAVILYWCILIVQREENSQTDCRVLLPLEEDMSG